jgi:hypothetical protein
VLAAAPRLTPVHNIKLTETRWDYALSMGASGRGTVTGTKPAASHGRYREWLGFDHQQRAP